MDTNFKLASVLISIALIICSLFSESNAQNWCGRTSNVRLCQSIVRYDHRTNLKNSLEGIGTILRDRAVATAVSTTTKISNLLQHNSKQKAHLQVCSQSYARAIPQLKSADFGHFNYGALVGAISNGRDAPHECKMSFQEPGAGASPLSREVDSLIDICSIILDIVNLRQCNRPTFC